MTKNYKKSFSWHFPAYGWVRHLICNNVIHLSTQWTWRKLIIIYFQTFNLVSIATNIEILHLVDVDENDASFTVVFNISMSWNDSRTQFNFLKSSSTKNMINPKLQESIWTPSVVLRLTVPSNCILKFKFFFHFYGEKTIDK